MRFCPSCGADSVCFFRRNIGSTLCCDIAKTVKKNGKFSEARKALKREEAKRTVSTEARRSFGGTIYIRMGSPPSLKLRRAKVEIKGFEPCLVTASHIL